MKRRAQSFLVGLVVALILAGLGFQSAFAQLAPRSAASNFDRRVPKSGGTNSALTDALSARVPGVQVELDRITGSPRAIHSRAGFLTGPAGQGRAVSAATAARIAPGDPHRAVKSFLDEHATHFGFGSEALAAAALRRDSISAHNGLRTVVWEQSLDGIEVFGGVLIGNITRQGELAGLSSQFMPNHAAAAHSGMRNRVATRTSLPVSAAQALVLAAGSVGPAPASSDVTRVFDPEGPSQRQLFQAPPILNGDSEVKLCWLPMGPREMRLCWQVVFFSKERREMFRVLIDAETAEPIVRHCLTDYISPATYRVYTSDSPTPFSPGWATPSTNQPPLVARSLVTLSALDTNASPNGWINDGSNTTVGNNVDAHLDRDRNDFPDLPRIQGSPFRVFDFPQDLSQSPVTYGSSSVVQLFYWCNWFHDTLYNLGFTEAAGNFQKSNFGRGGLGNDALQADALDGNGFNNANFSTPPDGLAPRMQMFIFNGPTPNRDGDLDAEIILHEHTHGVSGRLVGGGAGISALQTQGMGEGWSDFVSLSLLSEAGDDIDGNYAFGAYSSYNLIGIPIENYYYGLRRFPYTTSLSRNPLTFKDIDTRQALSHSPVPTSPFMPFDPGQAAEVHNQGEIWCVTLWQARRNLIAKYGSTNGNQIMLQLVIDGMKLCPVNPNFVQARDAIILADRINNNSANFTELWAAFAKRGLGGSATSGASSTTAGISEAFDLPGLSFDRATTSDLISGNGNGVIDYNECNDVFISLFNNATILESGISATLASSTPGVSIVQSNASYSPIVPGARGTNAFPFRISTSSAFVCGLPIDLAITVRTDLDTRVLHFSLPTGVRGSPVTFASSFPMPIPDNDPAGVDSSIQVSGINSSINSVTVSVYTTHSFISDLSIQLVGPDGTRIYLANQNGGTGANFGTNCSSSGQTVFDDAASGSIESGTAPFVGSFRPSQPLSTFVGKTGSAVNGTWKLHYVDNSAGDVGTLQCWSMAISPTICADGGGECSADVSVSTTYSPIPAVTTSNVTFSLLVTNRSAGPAPGVSVFDTLPAGMTFVSAATSAGTFTQTNGFINFSLGTLAGHASASLSIVATPFGVGPITNLATVVSALLDPVPANNTSLLDTSVNFPAPLLVSAGARMVAESFVPANSALDSGETVTLNFFLKNIGTAPTTNLVASLVNAGGVNGASASQTYGVLVPGGSPLSGQFTFTGVAPNQGAVDATLLLSDGAASLGSVAFHFGVGGTASVANAGVLILADNGPSSPYPSPLDISGLGGLISKATVTISNLTHSFADDVDILLVSPSGRAVLLMSDAGGPVGMTNVTLTFDDAAAGFLPDASQITAGTYRPTDYEPGDIFPAPAPTGPYSHNLSSLNGSVPNGRWNLFIVDDSPGDIGRISDGWSLTLTTIDPVNPAADLSLRALGLPEPVVVNGVLSYSIFVTNQGPSDAGGVVVTSQLPASVSFNSVAASQGTASMQGGALVANLGTVTNGTTASILLTVQATVPGSITNFLNVTTADVDLNPSNNFLTVVSTVNPAADLSITLQSSPSPVEINKNVTSVMTISNAGPNPAVAVVVTNLLPSGATFVSGSSSQGAISGISGGISASLGLLAPGTSAEVDVIFSVPVVGSATNTASVSSPTFDAVPANNLAVSVVVVTNPALIITNGATQLISESGLPANGGVDAGETVTINFGLRNIGSANSSTNTVALLRPGSGILSPSGGQTYGVLAAGGPAVSRPFTFVASPTNGPAVTAILDVKDGNVLIGTIAYVFNLGGVRSFGNTNQIILPDVGDAFTYPSPLVVTNGGGLIRSMTVTLSNLSHTFPDDLDILLVGPNGRSVLLMSDAGGGVSLNNVTLIFSDSAPALPDEAPIVSGTYRPTDYEEGDIFDAPAPVGPYGTSLSVFNGISPNGTWSLYMVDDLGGDAGRLANGWSLQFDLVDPVSGPADLSISGTASPAAVAVGSNVTFNVVVTNRGPSTATSVVVTNFLPAGATWVSASSSQGAFSTVAGQTVFTLGTLSNAASLQIVARLGTNGPFNNLVVVRGAEVDFQLGDNSAVLLGSGFIPLGFSGAQPVGNGQFKLTLSAENGASYVIEAATNLVSPVVWRPLSTNAGTPAGVITFTDTNSTGPARFYRARPAN